jgi:signal peptidase I
MRKWLRVGVVLLLLLLIAPAFVRAYRVHGPSDAPGFLWGDLILVHHTAYGLGIPFTRVHLFDWADPRPGDVVLCDIPGPEHVGFKRVVGVPGDVVAMQDNRLTVNGTPLVYEVRDPGEFSEVAERNQLGQVVERERGLGPDHLITFSPGAGPLATFGPVQVPEDHFFLMGDNRDRSHDSRRFGSLHRDRIHGRVVRVLRRAD